LEGFDDTSGTKFFRFYFKGFHIMAGVALDTGTDQIPDYNWVELPAMQDDTGSPLLTYPLGNAELPSYSSGLNRNNIFGDSVLKYSDPIRATHLNKTPNAKNISYGLFLAYQDNYDTAQLLWEDDLAAAGDAELSFVIIHQQQTTALMNLTWLAMFHEQWSDVEAYSSALLTVSTNNYVGEYAKASLAYRQKDYPKATLHLANMQNEFCPDLWSYQGRKLAQRIVKKDSESTALESFAELDLSAIEAMHSDEVGAHFNYYTYLTQSQKPLARELFAGHDIHDFKSFETAMKAVSGQLYSQDHPYEVYQPEWLAHLYFRSQMDYKAVAQVADRSLDEAYAWGEYDCTEYSEGICGYLNNVGTEACTIAYTSAETGMRHIFVAYEENGRWGFTSPMSYSEPKYESLEAVCQAWDQHRLKGDFIISKWEADKQELVRSHTISI
jgi:hypothetical protein